MSQIDVSIRLRPIRFLFLVHPYDFKNLNKIFEINTCLWGGMYNPIIPYLKKVPNWWDRNHKSIYSAHKILDYNIKFFEPDFIVETEQGMAESLNLSNDVILNIDDILSSLSDMHSYKGYGLNVFKLYKFMYQKEFKFVRRHEHRILDVKPEKERFKSFCSCIFGSFPNKKALIYIREGFKDAFDPKEILLNPDQLSSLYNKYFTSALKVGCEKLEVSHSRYRDPILFLLNAFDPRDLIDFWNFRIIEKNVLAIPIQWIDQLSNFCKKFILRNHKPLPNNPHGVMITTTIQMPRSISEDEGKRIYERYLKSDKNGASPRYWYPSFWLPPSEMILGYSRPTITSTSKRVRCKIRASDNSINFDSLHPEFTDDYSNRYCWANVIGLDNRFLNDDIAVVYPNNLHETTFPHLSLGLGHILTTTEGFVVFPEFKNSDEYWLLQDGTTAIRKWLERKNITSEISTPGKYALQIVKALGGTRNLSAIANPKIIDLLNKMAQKQVEWKYQENNGVPPKYYSGNTVQYSNLKKLIYEINKDNSWANFSVSYLTSGNVIKLGIEVRCNECEHWNWYSIDAINYELKCESCLSSFAFPTSNPTNRSIRWAYRAVGPFSNPDYAGGAYSTVFSIRFFKHLLGFDNAKITWSTSLTFQFKSGKKLETDFLLWYQRRPTFYQNYKPILVFGESKSFGKKSFEEKDILRLKGIANKFSGSVFVFSTMKESLSISEKKLIQSFALWGREYNNYGESKAPVIILTATELFARHNLSTEWKEQGGKYASLIEPAYIRLENLRILANITQQLYLDLPSYEDWWREEMRKKKAKKI